jgi:hypothetical protein
VREVLDIAGDIDGQIYMRDFKLIDQSDMIVSLHPRAARRRARPLQRRRARAAARLRAHQGGVRRVEAEEEPEPFITETATKIFADRCPECGLPVGDAFIRSALAPGGRARRRRSRTLDEISPAMFLLGAFWSVIVAALLLLALTARMGVSGLLIGAVGAAPIILSQMLALRLGARVVALRSRESETDPKTRQEAT